MINNIKNFGRIYRIECDDIPVNLEDEAGNQLRIVGTVSYGYSESLSIADLTIYNVSDNTINLNFTNGKKFNLKMGYESNIDYIFKGTVRSAIKGRIGPSTTVRIIALGGNIDIKNTIINENIGRERTIVDAIKRCGEVMGLPVIINENDFSSEPDFPNGYIMCGNVKDQLNVLGGPLSHVNPKTKKLDYNFIWSIENNRLVVVKNSSARGGETIEISPKNGMIGSPKIEMGFCEVSTLINPAIKFGMKFVVKTEYPEFINQRELLYGNQRLQEIFNGSEVGPHTVARIEHTFDLYADERWKTTVRGIRL